MHVTSHIFARQIIANDANNHPWQWPNQPWSRLHLDFAGPYMGHIIIIMVIVTSIPNGWMHTSCHRSHLQRPLRLSETFGT